MQYNTQVYKLNEF